MALLEREDIHTIEITLVDQARETVEFVASSLPSYACTTFWLYPKGLELNDAPQRISPTLKVQQKKGEKEVYSIENEFYSVVANVQDGTLSVTDKLTYVSFTGLNRFVDGGDVGDLYSYCPPEQDLLVSEPLEPPSIEVIQHGSVLAMLRISSHWALPASCTSERSGRNPQRAVSHIISEVTLVPGVRRIDVQTRVENVSKDHRLRVLFPVSYIVEQLAVDGTFEVRMRPLEEAHPVDSSAWAEAPVRVFPQKRFVDLSDGEHALAVLNRGLPECEVVQQGPGLQPGQSAVAITLLRCVEWLSRGDLSTRRGHAGPMEYTPEAQCLGVHTFDYALVPHAGNWEAEDGLVLKQAQAFQTPLATRACVVNQHLGISLTSLVNVTPASLLVSAIKQADKGEGLVVRLYNPLSEEVGGEISLGVAFEQAYMANLLEEYLAPLEVHNGMIPVRVCAGGILTVICV
jgi:hypothetical protein